MLARNRDSPLMPKDRSSSFVISNRLRCSSESMLYASDAVISGVSVSVSPGTIAPSMRNSGGTPAVRCRSDAFLATICSSRSLRVVTSRFSFVRRRRSVRRRFLQHFLGGRETALQLLQGIAAQRQHPVVDRRALDLTGRRALEDQVLDPRGERHHYVDALAAAVPGAVALEADMAVADVGVQRLVAVELQLKQRFFRQLDLAA